MEFLSEFTKAQIAVLVLGYLKSEKCYKAFDEFLEESSHCKKYKQNIKKGKYFVTRLAGMSLVDFLEEYANIYSIVQGRLEASNYYNEIHAKSTLVDQLLYLLDKADAGPANSTPVRSEVEATPAYTLPGHSEESDFSAGKTPKKKTSRNASIKNLDKEDAFDVSEVLTQTLLENHELHEKIAETINNVRNAPEVSKTVSEEHISTGASKELDAIIKTVVQRTEEDPVYNKLIDEIIGIGPFENQLNNKKSTSTNSISQNLPLDVEEEQPQRSNDKKDDSDRIEDHNNDAVRSIIAASQQTEIHRPQAPLPQQIEPQQAQSSVPQNNEANKNENGDVFVFDGTLDNYLKSSGGSNQVASNGLYINTGGLIVMPPETSSKQFYIVNNQPLINMNVSTVKRVITDNDIMTMPTIIVNDETQTTFTNQNFRITPPVTKKPPTRRRNRQVKPAAKITIAIAKDVENVKPVTNDVNNAVSSKSDTVRLQSDTVSLQSDTVSLQSDTVCLQSDTVSLQSDTGNLQSDTVSLHSDTVVVTASQTTPSATSASSAKIPTPRQASHVRNLDFSTPHRTTVDPKASTWDADLRALILKSDSKSPTPKRKKAITIRPKKKTKTKTKFEEKLEESKDTEEEVDDNEQNDKEANKEDPVLATPMKDLQKITTPVKESVPKTPGGELIPNTSFQCTPFTAVLEEQLRGVDLTSLPTPKIPITPGFALTPSDMAPYNRPTDYSTSSSYYQPSDNEQNKSLEQLIEECKRLENKSPLKSDKFSDLKILSDVVIEQAKIPINNTEHDNRKESRNEHLKNFNQSVIGKKNLNLLKQQTSSSSSFSESDTESEKSGEQSNNTVICKNANKKTDSASSINEIISSVKVKETLDEETRKKNLLTHLEEVRKRTVHKIKISTGATKSSTRSKQEQKKTSKIEVTKRKNTKKKEIAAEGNNSEEEAQKLVTGLAQRGIHLMHKKTPLKKKPKSEVVAHKTVDVPHKINKAPSKSKTCKGKEATVKKKVPSRRKEEVSCKTHVSKPKNKEASCKTDPTKPRKAVLCKIDVAKLENNEKPPLEEKVSHTDDEISAVTFDKIIYDSFEIVVHEEHSVEQKVKHYDLSVLNKTINAQLFCEELQKESVRSIKCTDFQMVADIPSKINVLTPRKTRRSEEEAVIDDDLMDYVLVNCNQDDTKGGRKRKLRSEDDCKQPEKKIKSYETMQLLMKKVDVDEFLDKVHGK